MARQTALRRLKVLLASLFIFIAARSPSMDAAEVHSPKGHVRAALDRRADIAFEHLHLTDIVGELRDRFHVELQLDEPSLKDIGVELDKTKSLQSHQRQLNTLSDATADRLTMMGIDVTTNTDIIKQITSLSYPGVSFQQKDVSLRSALRYILAEVGETVSVMERDGTLWVTSQEVADSHFTTRVYGVTDIAISPDSSHQVNDEAFNPAIDATHWDQLDYDTLIVILKSHVAPTTWDSVGGEGAIEPAKGSLTISQTGQAHEMIGAMLSALRQVRAETEKKPGEWTPIPVSPSAEMAERESRIADSLKKETSPDFDSVSLKDIAAWLATQTGFPVRMDRRAVAELGIKSNAKIRLPRQRLRLRSALDMALTSIHPSLTFSIDHEALLITTQERANRHLKTVLYPVLDLVREDRTETDGPPLEVPEDYDSLIDNIKSNVLPATWSDVGGNAAIESYDFGSALVITQTMEGHYQVVELLQQLRQEVANQKATGKLPKALEKQDDYVTVVFLLWQPWDQSAIVKERDVVELLRKKIEPESWQATEVSVETLPSRLIITQRKSIQRKIYHLLEKLAVLKPATSSVSPDKTQGGHDMGGFGGGFEGGMGGSFGAAGSLPPAGK